MECKDDFREGKIYSGFKANSRRRRIGWSVLTQLLATGCLPCWNIYRQPPHPCHRYYAGGGSGKNRPGDRKSGPAGATRRVAKETEPWLPSGRTPAKCVSREPAVSARSANISGKAATLLCGQTARSTPGICMPRWGRSAKPFYQGWLKRWKRR